MDTKDGLTAWEAIQLLFPEPEPEPEAKSETMIKPDLEPWSGGTTWVDHEYDERLRESLGPGSAVWPWPAVLSFQGLLLEGSWYGKGFRVPVDPTAGRERIQADLFDILSIDLDDNAAAGGGLEYEGLRFFAADAPAGSFATKTDLRRAYDRRVESERKLTGHAPTAKADESWGKGHGLSREKMRELRDNSPARTQGDRKGGVPKRKLAD